MSYRDHFESSEAASTYDSGEYGSGSYASLLWEIEKSQLDHIIDSRGQSPFSYLDFACGAGRVLAYVTPRASVAYGLDSSPAMVQLAKERVPIATIDVRDITADCEVERHYDVITAFRFILNAEPGLRLAALCALRERLKDDDSIIVINNHGNLTSHKAIMAVPALIRHRGKRQAAGNRMTHRAVVRTARDSGLQIERVGGCGLLGGRIALHLPRSTVSRLERAFSRSWLSRFGSNQMYVARRSLNQ